MLGVNVGVSVLGASVGSMGSSEGSNSPSDAASVVSRPAALRGAQVLKGRDCGFGGLFCALMSALMTFGAVDLASASSFRI